ncbi:MAG: hypothetical protein SWX82_23625 [Cyanobacteriota bacterium]|nr:hypothetical protein [Cyanobacteriota bacterium]
MGRWGDGEMGGWGDGEMEKYLVMVEDGTFFYTGLNGFDITPTVEGKTGENPPLTPTVEGNERGGRSKNCPLIFLPKS